ncbi:ribosome maturation factor RimM [Thiovibrio sp. JS02]
MEIRDLGPSRDGQIAVGKVVKAHGIKGEIKVYPFSGRPGDFSGYRRITLVEPRQGRTVSFEIAQSRCLANLAILRLVGLSERNGAEALRNWEVLVARESLPALAPGIYYWHELDGMTVRTDDGREIGKVGGRLSTGSQEILVVTGPAGEYLIPAVAEIVAGPAADGGALVITPPPGLLELNR